MIKSKLVKSVYGKQRVIEGYEGYRRLYVKKIKSTGTWIVSDNERVSLDSMIEIKGQYHFATLKELHATLNRKG
ncbi:MAG: hypothetical protein RBR97_20115 [Bacteroidales bacterium]|nr:hypothetical protein [Bacteroidales bacterium]